MSSVAEEMTHISVTASRPKRRVLALGDQMLNVLSIPGALAVFFLMVHTTFNAIFRSSGDPIQGTLEYSSFWYMPVIVFLGLALAQRRHEHVEAGMLDGFMTAKNQREFYRLAVLAMICLALLMAWFGLHQALADFEVRKVVGADAIAVWPFEFLVPTGFTAYAIQLALDLRGTPEGSSIAEIDVESKQALLSSSLRRVWTWRLVPTALLAVSVVSLFSTEDQKWVGAWALVMMLILMGMKFQLWATMALPGILGVYAIAGSAATESLFGELPFRSVAEWTLTVIPMFIMMGILLVRSGITEKLFVVAQHWVGWVPGGLAVGTNVAGAVFASISGSTLAMIFPLSRAAMPAMLRANYHRQFALGAVMGAGMLAPLLPSSLMLVVYAGVASVPIGPQMLAGIVPALILLVIYIAAAVVLSLVRPSLAGGNNDRLEVPLKEKLVALGGVVAAPLLVVAMVTGIYTGYLTVTEAAAAAALAALVICVVASRRPGLAAKRVWESADQTVSTTAALFLMLIGAYILTRLLAISGLAQEFVDAIVTWGPSRLEFLLLMIVIYIVLGAFMEPLPMMLLTVPTLLPILGQLDISLVWFGVFVVVFMELAMVMPPAGILIWVLKTIMRDPAVNVGVRISVKDVIVAGLWFHILPLILVVLMIAFPDLVTWLPDLSSS